MANSFCRKCGNPVSDQSSFCSKCGEMVVQRIKISEQEPVQQMPANAGDRAYEQMPGKKGSKPWPFALRCVISVLLSVVLLVTAVSSVAVLSIRRVSTEEGILEVLQPIELKDIPANVINPRASHGQTLADWLSVLLEDYSDGNVYISASALNVMVEDSTIKAYLAQQLAEFMDDLYAGRGDAVFTSREIDQLIRENKRLIEREMNVEFTDFFAKKLSDWLIDDDALELFSVDTIKDYEPGAVNAVKQGLSYETLGLLALLTVGCIVLLFVLNKRKAVMPLICVSTVFMLIGMLFTIPALAGGIMVQPVADLFVAPKLLPKIVKGVFAYNLPIALGLLAVGIVLLVLAVFLLRNQKKKAA